MFKRANIALMTVALAFALVQQSFTAFAEASFALEGFSRAQVGSQKRSGEEYLGYGYFAAGRPGNVSLVVTDAYAVVHLPKEASELAGLDASSESDAAALAALLMALDERGAKGGSLLKDVPEWVFVSQPYYERDGVAYAFDVELREGQFFTVVRGIDGSDVTDPSHPAHISLVCSDTARLVPAEGVAVTVAPEGFAALAQFVRSFSLDATQYLESGSSISGFRWFSAGRLR